MNRFVLGLGVGVILGLASVVVMLALLLRAPASAAGVAAIPTLLLENSRAKVWSLTLEPGQSTAQHTHELDEIVICLESSKLRVTKAGPEPEGETVYPKFGEVSMPAVKGVTHVLTNVGDTRYRQISIELKADR